MNYSRITEQSVEKRYNAAHDALRDVLDSPQTEKTIANISRAQYLDEEKTLRLHQLVALVLLGYLSTEELVHELTEQLFLNHEHARVIARELSDRIFDAVKEEIIEAYNPYDEETEGGESVAPQELAPITLRSTETNGTDLGETIRVSALENKTESPVSIPMTEGGPVVLQKGGSFFEKGFEKKEEKPEIKKPFNPFNIFPSSSESSGTRPSVKVKVETPQTFSWPFEKKSEEKVVHYSETRSSGSELNGGADIINLEAIQTAKPIPLAPTIPAEIPTPAQPTVPTTPTSAPSPVEAPVSLDAESLGQISIPAAGGPMLEGNVVHLK